MLLTELAGLLRQLLAGLLRHYARMSHRTNLWWLGDDTRARWNAMRLLRSHQLSLSEVTLACGFSDQSHFTRVFTRLSGTTPGTWRRPHQR